MEIVWFYKIKDYILLCTLQYKLIHALYCKNKADKKSIFFISFTLYLSYSREGTGNLVLRQSDQLFPTSSAGIMYWVVELNVAICLTRAKKWKY